MIQALVPRFPNSLFDKFRLTLSVSSFPGDLRGRLHREGVGDHVGAPGRLQQRLPLRRAHLRRQERRCGG